MDISSLPADVIGQVLDYLPSRVLSILAHSSYKHAQLAFDILYPKVYVYYNERVEQWRFSEYLAQGDFDCRVVHPSRGFSLEGLYAFVRHFERVPKTITFTHCDVLLRCHEERPDILKRAKELNVAVARNEDANYYKIAALPYNISYLECEGGNLDDYLALTEEMKPSQLSSIHKLMSRLKLGEKKKKNSTVRHIHVRSALTYPWDLLNLPTNIESLILNSSLFLEDSLVFEIPKSLTSLEIYDLWESGIANLQIQLDLPNLKKFALSGTWFQSLAHLHIPRTIERLELYGGNDVLSLVNLETLDEFHNLKTLTVGVSTMDLLVNFFIATKLPPLLESIHVSGLFAFGPWTEEEEDEVCAVDESFVLPPALKRLQITNLGMHVDFSLMKLPETLRYLRISFQDTEDARFIGNLYNAVMPKLPDGLTELYLSGMTFSGNNVVWPRELAKLTLHSISEISLGPHLQKLQKLTTLSINNTELRGDIHKLPATITDLDLKRVDLDLIDLNVFPNLTKLRVYPREILDVDGQLAYSEHQLNLIWLRCNLEEKYKIGDEYIDEFYEATAQEMLPFIERLPEGIADLSLTFPNMDKWGSTVSFPKSVKVLDLYGDIQTHSFGYLQFDETLDWLSINGLCQFDIDFERVENV